MIYLINAGKFLIDTFFYAAVGIFLLRFVLIAVGASFYEPVCRAIYGITNPVITPLRRFVPSWRRFELASCLVAWVLMLMRFVLLNALFFQPWRPLALLFGSLVAVVDLLVLLEIFAIIAFCVLSFFPSLRYEGSFDLLRRVIDPVWAPFRRRIPPLGGIGISAWVATIALTLLRILVISPLADLTARWP